MLTNDKKFTNISTNMSNINNANDPLFYDGIETDQDFLAELSMDLDIPMLLESDNFSHFLEDITSGEIISEIDEVESINPSNKDVLYTTDGEWGNDPFLNLMIPKSQQNIKTETCNNIYPLDNIVEMDTGQNGFIIKHELSNYMKNEPCSPQRDTPSPSDSNSSGDYVVENGTGVLNNQKYDGLDTPPISPQQQVKSTSTNLVSPVVITSCPSVQYIRTPDNKVLSNAKNPTIQPRPITSATNINTKNKNTIVLSAQQFAALAKSGKLQKKINDIKIDLAIMKKKQRPILMKNEQSNDGEQGKISDAKVAGLSFSGGNPESRISKKHQRMIKNRESACLSRKKKKEYVTSLEGKIAELTLENSQLKLENAQLKARLEVTLNEQNPSNKIFNSFNKSPSLRKNAAFLLAMVVMVTVNFGSVGKLFMQSPKLSSLDDADIDIPIGGRHLLWVDNNEDNTGYPNFNPSREKQRENDIAKNHSLTSAAKYDRGIKNLDQPICPMYINVSESLRLESELRRWIGEPDSRITTNYTQESRYPDDLSLKKLLPIHAINESTKSYNEKPKKMNFRNKRRSVNMVRKRNNEYAEENMKRFDDKDDVINEVDVFRGGRHTNYLEFYEAINRRDDTFYVVSFNYDHLLLPAVSHNNTLRPKMSLLMPVIGTNDSSSSSGNHVKLMQIDCEVTDTSLLHVNYKSIPQHLRPTNNVNNDTQEDTRDAFGPQRDLRKTLKDSKNVYKPYFIRNKPYRPSLIAEKSNGTD